MGKGLVCVYNGLLLSKKKDDDDSAICNNTDKEGGYAKLIKRRNIVDELTDMRHEETAGE